MSEQDDSWGPGIEEYSRSFNLEDAKSSDPLWESDFPGTWRDNNIIPISTLKDSLTRSDLKLGYCYGDRPLTALLLTLWNYNNATKHSIFGYYYGFLCVRCIIHMVCIGILLQTDALDNVLKSLDKNMNWKQVNSAMANEAMYQASSITRAQLGFRTNTVFEPAFGEAAPLNSVGSIAGIDIMFIVNLLWEDRVSFFSLCSRGLLPGATIILFTIYQVALVKPIYRTPDVRLLVLQDLAIRQYLIAPHLDKCVLRAVCLSGMEQAAGRDIAYWGTVLPEDACALADAYIELLASLYDDDADLTDLSIIGIIYQYVNSMLRRGAPTQGTILAILEESMDFLWLVYSKRRRPQGLSHTSIRLYAALIFDAANDILKDLVKTNEEKLNFARTIERNDLLALAGRTLLLATEREVRSDGFRWDWSIEVYNQLCMTLSKCTAIAPLLFDDSIITWAKVLDHVQIWHEMGHLNSYEYHLLMNAWSQFGIILGAQFVPRPHRCAYPRCFQRGTNEGVLGVRLICGRCGLAVYCSSTCQHAHWQLRTIDSHKFECFPLAAEARSLGRS